MENVNPNDTKNFFDCFFEMDAIPMDGDRFSWINIRWSVDGNKEEASAAIQPGMVRKNRAALVIALVRGALEMAEGEELNEDAKFNDVLNLISGFYTSREEYEELRTEVFDPYTCHEKFRIPVPPEEDEE